jgi:hypothetical protein
MTKKQTITRKTSLRDFINLAYFLETGEMEADLSECDPAALAVIEKRSIRVTPEQKVKVDEFFNEFPLGFSYSSLIDKVPKIGVGQFIQVPKVATPINNEVEVDQPEMILPGEVQSLVRPKNLPHWVKDPLGKLEPDNIDVAEIARIVEEGEQSLEEMKEQLLKLGTPDHPEKMLAAHPNEFEETLGDRYTYAVTLLDVIEFASKKREKYVAIMTEAPPSEEENFERYFTYVLSTASIPKHPDAYGMVRDAETVTSFSDNKIVFDNNDETVLE